VPTLVRVVGVIRILVHSPLRFVRLYKGLTHAKHVERDLASRLNVIELKSASGNLVELLDLIDRTEYSGSSIVSMWSTARSDTPAMRSRWRSPRSRIDIATASTGVARAASSRFTRAFAD
jgi:hypothetical protein